MSFLAGNCAQPECAVDAGIPVAAPQRGHVAELPSTTAPHQEHFTLPPVCGMAV
jgi:hypothetical protein